MSYQVIARKWRPQTFEEVTGQEAITRTLRNALEFDRLHHAYLFSGARGVGKTTTARLLAKALNCQKFDKPTVSPCSFNDETACASCKEIAEGRSMDVLEFDAASNTQVDKIRDLIIENINISPARDRYKIFIIDEVHMLSNSSFNALLKTLEEPPPRVVFIMATTELHKLPDTILSRIQQFEFRTISVNKIFERLKIIADAENIKISDVALREIARAGEGSMRDAQSAFDQVISFSGETIEIQDVAIALGVASAELLTRVMNAVADQNPKDVLLVVDELIGRGQDLRNFCRDLLTHTRDLLVFKASEGAANLLDTASISLEEMKTQAAKFSESDLIRFFHSLTDTEDKIKMANQPRYQLEIGLVKLTEMKRVAPFEKILERLAQLENALANGNFSSVQTEKKTLELNQTPEKREISNPPNFAPKIEVTPRFSTPKVENPAQNLPKLPTNETSFAPKIATTPPISAPTQKLPVSTSTTGGNIVSAAIAPVFVPDFDDFFDDELEGSPVDFEFERQFARDTTFAPPKMPETQTAKTLPVSPSRQDNSADIRTALMKALEKRGLPFYVSGIEQAQSVKIENDELKIELTNDLSHFQTTFEKPENTKILRDIGREISGRELKLKIVIFGQKNIELSPEETAKKREKEILFRRAEQLPSVQSFIKIFRGEIVDVIETGKEE